MTFGEALKLVNEGKCIARESWNGKNMCVYKVESSEVRFDQLKPCVQNALQHQYELNIPNSLKVLINHHLDMVNAQGQIIVGWTASQTDMLANDWYVLKDDAFI